jgi:hypothetical protein
VYQKPKVEKIGARDELPPHSDGAPSVDQLHPFLRMVLRDGTHAAVQDAPSQEPIRQERVR